MRVSRVAMAAAVCVALSVAPSSADVSNDQAQAKALATAINLTAADLPGFTDEGAPQIAPERSQASCLGALPLLRKRTALVTSDIFRQEPAEGAVHVVVSGVYVYPSPKLARAFLTAIRSDRFRQCSIAAIRDDVFPGRSEDLRVAMRRLRSKLARSVTWRTPILWKGGTPEKQIIDGTVFARGQAVVSLSLTSWPDPFPQDLGAQLASLLAKRASRRAA